MHVHKHWCSGFGAPALLCAPICPIECVFPSMEIHENAPPLAFSVSSVVLLTSSFFSSFDNLRLSFRSFVDFRYVIFTFDFLLWPRIETIIT